MPIAGRRAVATIVGAINDLLADDGRATFTGTAEVVLGAVAGRLHADRACLFVLDRHGRHATVAEHVTTGMPGLAPTDLSGLDVSTIPEWAHVLDTGRPRLARRPDASAPLARLMDERGMRASLATTSGTGGTRSHLLIVGSASPYWQPDPAAVEGLHFVVEAFARAATAQRHNAELRKSADHLHVTIACGSAVVAAFDLSGRVTYVSPSWEALTGWPVGGLLGRYPDLSIFDFGGPMPALPTAPGGCVPAAGLRDERIVHVRRADGGRVRCLASLATVHAADGSVTGLVGTLVRAERAVVTGSAPATRTTEFAGMAGARVPAEALLSSREREVLGLLAAGLRVPTIARRLFISQHTVRNHLKAIFRKVGVASQAELMEYLRADDGRP